MLISEFARTTKLTQDTIRFYIKRGLLTPETGSKGGSKPYQMFRTKHVEAARTIRLAQSLGFSLREIAALNSEYQTNTLSITRQSEIMDQQLAKLEEKAAHLNAMIAYVRSKRDWLRSSDGRPEPKL